jgi:hypothetical protein
MQIGGKDIELFCVNMALEKNKIKKYVRLKRNLSMPFYLGMG